MNLSSEKFLGYPGNIKFFEGTYTKFRMPEEGIDDDEVGDEEIVEADDGVEWTVLQNVVPDDLQRKPMKVLVHQMSRHRLQNRSVLASRRGRHSFSKYRQSLRRFSRR